MIGYNLLLHQLANYFIMYCETHVNSEGKIKLSGYCTNGLMAAVDKYTIVSFIFKDVCIKSIGSNPLKIKYIHNVSETTIINDTYSRYLPIYVSTKIYIYR